MSHDTLREASDRAARCRIVDTGCCAAYPTSSTASGTGRTPLLPSRKFPGRPRTPNRVNTLLRQHGLLTATPCRHRGRHLDPACPALPQAAGAGKANN
jgi:hypothetical protein